MPVRRASRRATASQKPRVRALRRNLTWPERRLWSMLRNRRLGDAKFKRQQVVGPFIVDFLCPEAKLVIEVDGETHVGRGAQDRQRDAFLQHNGFRVLRVTNDEVLRSMDAVLEAVLRLVAK
jgi:very-short-patch-repair endonuclease